MAKRLLKKSIANEGSPVVSGEPDQLAQPVDEEGVPHLPFVVVGVGASAGGLEAYTEFLEACSAESGMAFVLIQHLSPKHESLMAELLAKHTAMPVLQVTDSMKVDPNHVYIIRPGYTMTIANGRLHLGESAAEPGHRRPVDDFFRSLAKEQRHRAICVVLSGTGSNGTAGAQNVKAVGGICIAQEPESAKFPAMPRSLIDSGMADAILPPKEMFAAIVRFVSHPYSTGRPPNTDRVAHDQPQAINEVVAILRTRVRHDFSGYKRPTLLRRIERRMSLLQIEKVPDYVRALRQSPAEISALSDDMLIHVTGFFRDPEVWEVFRERVIDPLIREKEDGSTIRAWVTACSSGEEAYTLGILLLEAAEKYKKHIDIKVFATDAAERSLSQARAGVFPGGIESEVAPDRLERFFEKNDLYYRVRKELRELVVFAPQNLLQDPPFSRLDICTCRNLLIYIESEVQQRILGLLHFGLREGGALLLGNSETIAGADELFEAIDKKHRIFRRVGPTRHGTFDFPVSHDLARQIRRRQTNGDAEDLSRALPQSTLAQLTAKLLLEKFTPAAVVVDRQGQIVYYHGETEQYLVQPRGGPTRELLLLAREEVRGAVRSALQRAMSQNQTSDIKDGTMGEGPQRVRIFVHVVPLEPRITTGYFLVGFEQRPDPPPLPSPQNAGEIRSDELADELGRVRDELQSTIEELQTSNEEMKASHEEVTSINEELQSSNEELETSKEELQSLNEELTTVNAQLQAKMEEVERARNDLSSLLSSTDIAVIFLDRQFRIRRFTPAVRDLLDLISSDVGRPLNDLARKFTDLNLIPDAEGVLNRLAPSEREIVAEGNRSFLRRITPYRTSDDRIDGIVVTFIDITARTRAEAALLKSQEKYRSLFESMDEAFCLIEMIFDESGKPIDYLHLETNPAFVKHTQQPMQGKRIREVVPNFEQFWLDHYGRVATTGIPMHVEHVVEGLGNQWFETHAFRFSSEDRGHVAVLFTNITERKSAEAALRQSEERYRSLFDSIDEAFVVNEAIRDAQGKVIDFRYGEFNPAFARVMGRDDLQGKTVREVMPDIEGKWIARYEDLLNTGQPIRFQDRLAGLDRWLDVFASRVGGADSQRIAILFTDISTRKAAEKALEAAKDAAEHSSRIKDEFLATISHELRTPLSGILLWSKMLQKPEAMKDAAQLREGLAAIEQGAESQKRLVEDLLDAARITSGKLRLNFQHIDLIEVVHDAVDAIAPTAQVKGIAIEPDYGDDVGIVHADPERLRQVVWNLLSNAVKFTPSDGKVHVRVLRFDGSIEIRISDNGRGIGPEHLPKIFERFAQADAPTNRSSGLGLGLAIARQLVELHGGTIEVQSDGAGKGSVFTIKLPLPKIKPESTASKAVKADQIQLEGVRVLVVEDDERTRRATEMLLKAAGATVSATATVADAVKAYAAAPPHIILSDIGLPDEDGYTLLTKIREIEYQQKLPKVPAVALTAYARDMDRRRAESVGFSSFLAKPEEPDRILATLAALVNGGAAKREH